MTTIAWDGISVAADTQGRIGDYTAPKPTRKLYRDGDIVYAFSGCTPLFKPMREWHKNGADPKTAPSCEDKDSLSNSALIVFEKGTCKLYRPTLPYPEDIDAPDAWGSGADFAIGAMVDGASARRAVEVASICNPDTGGEINVEELL